LWLIKDWFSASIFVVKIANFAKRQNVRLNHAKNGKKMGLFNWFKKKATLTDQEKEESKQDKLLIAAVAEINAQNGSYVSPLASMPGVKIISRLTYACLIGKTFMVKEAINNGSDVNETDDEGRTPLHAASKEGYLEIVEILLEQGADKTRLNKEGLLPIHLAAKNGHESIVALLKGADHPPKE
jgi:ankyrin repeat protein